MQKGIDVSHWSGVIDWKSVKNSNLVSFVFAKATEGISFVDDQWLNNKTGCQNVGMPHGAYHFFRPSYDPAAQASHLVETAGSDIGVYVCDVETVVLQEARERVTSRLASPLRLISRVMPALGAPELLGRAEFTREENTYINAIVKGSEYERVSSLAAEGVQAMTLAEKVKVFMETLGGLTGKTGVIYTSPGFWNAYVDPQWKWDMPYDLWVAHWTTLPEPILPKTWDEWVFWQYTNNLVIPGIKSKTDGDRAPESLDLYAYFKNGKVPPPPDKFLVRITADYLRMRDRPWGAQVGMLRRDNVLMVTKEVKDPYNPDRQWYYSGDYGCFAGWWAELYEG